jgi:uncharacterized protein YcbK (DUF882 family)
MLIGGTCGIFAFLTGTSLTQNAIANGDTRTITIAHMHTKETTTATFRRNGQYDSAALEKLNWALRDWRRDEPTKMDPRLFDIAWEVHRSSGSSEAFHVVSAYRSPATNSMLRRRSRGVAKHSQHMAGKAMDFYLPDVSPSRVREIGMRIQRGGVGFYPSANNPFIHLDVGSVRSWPRMTRDQLVRLFPDGKTVHLPADGQPMGGYEVAKAEILARGGTVGGYATSDFDEGAIMSSGRKSLWASLFGGDDEDEAPARGRRGGRPNPAQVLAYAGDSNSENGGRFATVLPVQTADTTSVNLIRERSARIRPERPGTAAPTQVAALAKTPETAVSATAKAETEEAKPAPAAKIQLVMVPLPTLRPKGLKLPDAAKEPVALAAASATDAGAAIKLVNAALPPLRPIGLETAESPAPALKTLTAKLPPERPVIPETPVARMSAEPAPKLVKVAHAPPPERPRLATEAVPVAVASAPQTTKPAPSDRAGLSALFEAAASPTVSTRPVIVATAKARASNASTNGWTVGASPAASLGFSKSDSADGAAGKFSGSAVRGMPTTFVQP